MSLNDKVVLLTGACTGIGTVAAENFVKKGAKVVLVGRNEDNLRATEAKCKEVNGDSECLVIKADIIEDATVLINQTLERFGRIDVLVNYAGTLARGGILDMDLEQFDHLMNVNLRAVFLLTKLASQHLIASKGTIINVSSISGSKPNSNSLGCCVLKAALEKFTECIALEFAPLNVSVFSVDPSMTLSLLQKPHVSDGSNALKAHRGEHSGDISDVAETITQLALGSFN